MRRIQLFVLLCIAGLCGIASAASSTYSGPFRLAKRVDNPETGRDWYQGSVTVSGRWWTASGRQINEDAPVAVCFRPHAKYTKLFPLFETEVGEPYRGFCLLGRKNSLMLGVSDSMLKALDAGRLCTAKGRATITITNYSRYTGGSEDTDIADIAQVHSRSKPLANTPKPGEIDNGACVAAKLTPASTPTRAKAARAGNAER